MVSGVFAEAVACGAATVVPADTWMASMVERGRAAGVVFDKYSTDSVTGAVARAVARLDDLRRQAAGLAESWRAEQSISAYFERLLDELGQPAR
jgi:glycosyltransferase involved in cell wall biosynthesis